MKKLTYILLTLLVFSACTGTSRHPQLVAMDSLLLSRPDSALTLLRGMSFTDKADRMYHSLLLADACNKCYDTLPSDSILQEVTDYYDHHGSANEQVRAHYLLGCAYRDMGEAPMALQCYQQAIECADTLSDDCDFAQLSKVYGQTGHVFYNQRLVHQQLPIINKAIEYALIAKDTLTAMSHYWQKYNIYEEADSPSIAISIIDTLALWYKNQDKIQLYARAKGRAVYSLLHTNENKKAKEYMNIYEQLSGLFDNEGNIEAGREIYYYYKGLYYLNVNTLDSAEFYYRKELNTGKDYNNQNGGALGLAKVYEQRHQPDSAAKYYQYAYAMNDSMYAQMATSEVERMQAMYDYTRHQEVARQKTIEANRSRQAIMAGSFAGLLVFTLLLFALYRNRRKKQEEITLLQRQYEHDVDKLEQARYDLVRMQEEQLTRLMEEKEADIRELQRQVDAYGQQARPEDRLEGFLSETASYRRFRHFIMHPQEKATVDDWKLLHDMIDQKLPAFRTTLYSAQPGLKASDYDICVLDRLYFTPSEIAMLTGKNLSSITMKRVRLLDKLFHVTGKGSQFDAFIRKIS